MSEAAPTVGARLKAERERRGMSTQKVADEMHLDVWVIDALENDDYQRIGPTVYARGHLKRYAGILGLPPTSVESTYEAKTPISAQVASAPAVVMRMPRSGPVLRAPWLRIGGAALLVAAAAAAWLRPWQHRFPSHAAAPASAAAGAAATSTPAGTSAPGAPGAPDAAVAAIDAKAGSSGGAGAAPSADTAGSEGAAGVSADEGAGPANAAAAANPSAAASASAAANAASPANGADPAGAGHARLRLSFSADSWVEVHDATGRRVFAGNGRANSVQTISGEAPLTVYLGYAGGVQLEVNDRVVAIGPQFISGDVARFEAGADGVLRRYSHPAPAPGATAPGGSPHG